MIILFDYKYRTFLRLAHVCILVTWFGWVALRILHRLILFQLFRDYETGDTHSLKSKWPDQGFNPGSLPPQAKNLTTTSPLLPEFWSAYSWYVHVYIIYSSKTVTYKILVSVQVHVIIVVTPVLYYPRDVQEFLSLMIFLILMHEGFSENT